MASLAQPFGNPQKSPAGQYLTFRVGREDLAMRADRIIAFLPADQLLPSDELSLYADVPDLAGLASVGRQLLPVIALGRRLGLRKARRGRSPCIVVVELFRGPQRYLSGFVADVVSDIVTVRTRDIQSGMLRLPGRPRRVVDPDEVLSWGE